MNRRDARALHLIPLPDFLMKPNHSMAARAVSVLLLLAPAFAVAGEGHDHGDSTPAASGPALPRFTAVSETFELVGVLSGKQLTLYLDRYADNSPVPDAQIEIEIGGVTFKAEKHGDAVYEVVLKEAPREGVLPITATVTAGSETDLLAGEIDVHVAAHADDIAPARSRAAWAGWAVWAVWVVWAAGGLAVLGLLVFAARRIAAVRASSALRAGGAA